MRMLIIIIINALVAIVVAVICSIGSQAHAAMGTWADNVKGWKIIGDSDHRACWARTTFEDGITMGIGFVNAKNATAIWTIEGVNAVKDKSYSVRVGASNGSSGVLTGQGMNDNSIAFFDINLASVKALAEAGSVYVQGLGRYNLYGSRAAMLKAWECYQALSSY